MKTDSIFYRIFQSYPSAFFELIGRPDRALMGYQFRSVEVKQLAFRIDGIFDNNSVSDPIYFAEVQFQKDDRFFQRTISEIMLYIGQMEVNRSWQFVPVFANPAIEPELPRAYELLKPNIQAVYLNELEQLSQPPLGVQIVDLVVCKAAKAQDKVRKLIPIAQSIKDIGLREGMIDLIETILIYKFEKLSRREIEIMFGLSELKKTRVYQEGIEEGGSRVLIRQLSRKFGTLNPAIINKIGSLSLEQLEELGEAILDFGSIQEVEAWLSRFSP